MHQAEFDLSSSSSTGNPRSGVQPHQPRAWAVPVTVVLLLALSALVGSGQLSAQDVDVSGTWNMTVQSQQGTTNPTVTLQQDGQSLTGRYSSQTLGDADITGSVDGNEITFSFTANVGGQSVPVSYTATVGGGEMSGNLNLAGQEAGSFTAARDEG